MNNHWVSGYMVSFQGSIINVTKASHQATAGVAFLLSLLSILGCGGGWALVAFLAPCAQRIVSHGGHARSALCAWRRKRQRLVQVASGSIAKMRRLRRGAACQRLVSRGRAQRVVSWGGLVAILAPCAQRIVSCGSMRATRCVRGGGRDNASSKWPQGPLPKCGAWGGGRPVSALCHGGGHSALCHGGALCATSWGVGAGPAQRVVSWGGLVRSALCHGGALCATRCVTAAGLCAARRVTGAGLCATRCVMGAGLLRGALCQGGGPAHNALCTGGLCSTPCFTGRVLCTTRVQRLVLRTTLCCPHNALCPGGGSVHSALCHGRACAQRVVSRGRACAQRVVSWGRACCATRRVSEAGLCATRCVTGAGLCVARRVTGAGL